MKPGRTGSLVIQRHFLHVGRLGGVRSCAEVEADLVGEPDHPGITIRRKPRSRGLVQCIGDRAVSLLDGRIVGINGLCVAFQLPLRRDGRLLGFLDRVSERDHVALLTRRSLDVTEGQGLIDEAQVKGSAGISRSSLVGGNDLGRRRGIRGKLTSDFSGRGVCRIALGDKIHAAEPRIPKQCVGAIRQ